MSGGRRLFLILALGAALPLTVWGQSARVALRVADEQGRPVGGGLFVFAGVDDPTRQFTIGEDELGRYEDTVPVSSERTSWKLSKVVVEGFLPVKIGIRSSSGNGEPLETVEAMELDPGTPLPPFSLVAGGRVEIELTLGDKAAVMKAFLEARNRARAEAEAQAAARAEASRGPYATALRLYREGDVEGSLPHFRQAIGQAPDDAQIRTTYAQVLYKAERFEEFDREARPLLELQPDNRELWMMLYTARRSRGEMGAALDALIAVKQLGTADPSLLEHFDFVARKIAKGEQAIRAYRAMLDLDADHVGACVALAFLYADGGRSDLADAHLERAVALAPQRAPAIHFELASRLLGTEPQGERLARAIALLRRAIELDPGFAPPYKKLGLALWRAKDYPGARRAFERYLESSPGADDEAQIREFLATLPE